MEREQNQTSWRQIAVTCGIFAISLIGAVIVTSFDR